MDAITNAVNALVEEKVWLVTQENKAHVERLKKEEINTRKARAAAVAWRLRYDEMLERAERAERELVEEFKSKREQGQYEERDVERELWGGDDAFKLRCIEMHEKHKKEKAEKYILEESEQPLLEEGEQLEESEQPLPSVPEEPEGQLREDDEEEKVAPVSCISYSIERFENTDCLVNKNIEIRERNEFSSDDDAIEYGKINGYDYITFCPKTVYFKRAMSYTEEEIIIQLNENKSNPRYTKKKCTVIKIKRSVQ